MLVNELTWSKSRADTYQSCKRQYWLSYYGSWGGWEPNAAPEVREAYIQKNLKSLPLYAGIVTHELAEFVVTRIRNELPIEDDVLLAIVEARVREECQLSAEGRYREGIKIQWAGREQKALGLAEHYYGQILDPDRVVAAVRNFAYILTSPRMLRWIRKVLQNEVVSIERLESFPIDGVKVWVKMDLAVRSQGGMVSIIDWKTGDPAKLPSPSAIARQLAIYGLYFVRTYGTEPCNIRLLDANLRSGDVTEYPVDPAHFDQVELGIVESIAILRELENSQHDRTFFPETEDRWRCRYCVFRRSCGRE